MAYSLKNASRRFDSETKNRGQKARNLIAQSISYVNGLDIITDNIRYGLVVYTRYRVTRSVGRFQLEELKTQIKTLLSACCGKPFLSISLQDVENNEFRILYQIRAAMVTKSVNQLYKCDIENNFALETIIGTKRINEKPNMADVIKYFEVFGEMVEI